MDDSSASAAESNAIAGTASAIQDAIDDLGGAPGTIYLKAGEFNLGGIVTLHEGVKIIGAGPDFTTINTPGDQQWLSIPDGADNCRISGIKFAYPAKGKGQAIYIGGEYSATVMDFRIDNCEFYGYGYYESAIRIRGDVRGVIDHNYFENTQMTWSSGYGYGVMYDGDNTYTTDTSKYLGTAENVFIEDNEFRYCRHSIAANRGAHYVFRDNWSHDGILGQQVDAHGGYSNYSYGTILADVYNNVIEDYVSGTDRAMKFRGGQFIVHDNYSTDYNHFMMLQLENGATKEMALKCKIHDSYEWNNKGLTDVYVDDGDWDSTDYIRKGVEYFTDTPHPTYKPYTYPHPLTQENSVIPINSPVSVDDRAMINITANEVNNPPAAANQAVTTSGNPSVNITLSGSDIEGDPLTFHIVSGPSNGSLTPITNNALTSYTPGEGFTGKDNFTFRAYDGKEYSNLATVTITGNVPPSKPAISISKISYATEGGRYGEMDLLVKVSVADDTSNPVGNASVSIDVYRDGNLYYSETGTTGPDGSVTYKATKAPTGLYTTRVNKISVDGLTWDGLTPTTNFPKL